MRGAWQERLRGNAIPDDNGCWIWQGALDRDGYGRFTVAGVESGAHRWAYAAAHGSMPDGLDVDHLCFTRSCVNPDHLEAVTRVENNRRRDERADRLRGFRCPQGHERIPANLVIESGKRRCGPCRREKERRSYQRKVAGAA